MTKTQKHSAEWWRGAFLYQIYPRSFLDTNNDGVGDLPGITEKLDYVASLGVEGIWISPFYKSPMKDFGYDVTDYRDIDPLFGTLADFDALLEKAHSLGLKIIIDLVLSHTSDQHPWFKDPSKKNWYVWADGKDGGPPNNWTSCFGGSAWEYSKRYKQYYLHNFLKEQPDLNFHNPKVQEEILNIARFWLERGVDGFRLDVVNFYFHDKLLRDNPPRDPALGAALQFEGHNPYSEHTHIYDKSRPENLGFLSRLRELTNQYGEIFTVGEIGDDHPYERSAEYTQPGLINSTYNTQMMGGITRKLEKNTIQNPIERFLRHTKNPFFKNSWPSWAFSNHDVTRSVSRWLPGSAGFSHDPKCAQMLIALLGCLRGTVFLYQGEELGLPETRLDYDQIQDPWGKETWPEWQGRDGCRTPMPWDEQILETKTWLPIPERHRELLVSNQEHDQNSTLNFTRKFIAWRKTQPVLITGNIEFIETKEETQLSFYRSKGKKKIRCDFDFINFSFQIEGFTP